MQVTLLSEGEWVVDQFSDEHNHLFDSSSKVIKKRSHSIFHRSNKCKDVVLLSKARMKPSEITKIVNAFRGGEANQLTRVQCFAIVSEERKAAPPKPKASVRRTRSSSDTSITPPTAAASLRLTASAKAKQTAKASKAKSLSALSEVAMKEAQKLKLVTKRSIQQTHISQASGSRADEGTGKDGDDDEEDEGNDGEEGDNDDADQEVKRDDDKDDEEEDTLKRKQEDELYRDVNINQGRGIQPTLEVEDSHVTLTPVNPDGQQQSSSVSSQFVTSMLNPTLDVGMESIFETTSQMDTQTPTSVAPLPMTAPTMTPSTIATITITSQAPILPTISNHLRDEAQRENDDFLKTVDENMQKIIKEQVKKQVKTSYAVAADLSEMELKKILIEKMKGNKSIQRSDEQRNLYKALVEAYESDKIILDTYEETVTLKRRHYDDADKDEEPSAGPDPGSKRRIEGKEPESASAPTKTATRSTGSIQPWIRELTKRSDSRSSFNELMDTPLDFSSFLINRLKVDTLTLKLLVGPTYELMKGSCKSLVELENHLEEVFKATTDQLDWVNPEGASSRKYTTSITKMKAANYGHIKWIEDLVPRTIWIKEPIGYDKDDDKLYKFKEGDFKRLRIQDIEDMLLLLVQGKLTNLTVEEHFAFNVSLRMFTRSIVIQRRVEDL
nr:protein FAR1-related sequence 5-like [Tanacetum cinerariifolium]